MSVDLAVDELATYAQTNSIGTIGTNLFRFALTPTPDAQVALIPYGGRESEDGFGTDGIRWEYPRIQVVSRGPKNDPRTAATKAQDVYIAFGKIQAETLGSTFWHHAKCLQPPFSLGVDDTGRPLIGFNVECHRDLGA